MSLEDKSNPYASPLIDEPPASVDRPQFEYVGFWWRVVAALIDTAVIFVITSPLLIAVYGWTYYASDRFIQGPLDVLINWVFPAVATVTLWMFFQATPGKMLVGAKVVDARSGEPASTRQYVLRYIGYFIAMLPLMVGILWVAFDSRKQGFHDKLAGTVVIRPLHG